MTQAPSTTYCCFNISPENLAMFVQTMNPVRITLGEVPLCLQHVQANKGGNRKLCWVNSVPSVGTKTDIGTWTLDS